MKADRLSRESSSIGGFQNMIGERYKNSASKDNDRFGIEVKLEEALMINSKLFEKVKRLEQQVRDLVHF